MRGAGSDKKHFFKIWNDTWYCIKNARLQIRVVLQIVASIYLLLKLCARRVDIPNEAGECVIHTLNRELCRFVVCFRRFYEDFYIVNLFEQPLLILSRRVSTTSA